MAGLLHCQQVAAGLIRCDLGQIRLHPNAGRVKSISEGPLENGFSIDLGNPHMVFFVDDPEGIQIAQLAPRIQQHRYLVLVLHTECHLKK